LKGSKAELEAPEANYEGKGDPNQIVDKVRFFHRIKFSSESFVWSGKENTSTGRKLQEEKWGRGIQILLDNSLAYYNLEENSEKRKIRSL